MADGAVRVLVVDDEEVIRGLLAMACERHPELELAGQAATGAQALELSAAEAPDVVVLDLGLPDIGGLEVARRLRAGGPTPLILILTGRPDRAALFEAHHIGVEGLVEKTRAIGLVGELIHRIAGGETIFTDQQARDAREELRERIVRTREASRVSAVVTDREREVLGLLAEGATTRQIARRLELSERTVEAHLGKLFRKLGAKGRVQAVAAAAALGLLVPRIREGDEDEAPPPATG